MTLPTPPASVYQLHPGGWLRRADAAAPPLAPPALDAALADTLVPYAHNLGFTQIELLSKPASALPLLAERCDAAGLALLPPGSSALLVAASEDGMGFDDPWRTSLAAEWRRRLLGVAADDPGALPDRVLRFANLRARIALMWAQPGAKRVAMGSEFAQARPWTLDGGLDWHLLADPLHEGVQRLVHDLNHLRGTCTALREPGDALFDPDGDDGGLNSMLAGALGSGQSAAHAGFYWIDRDDVDGAVLAFSRVANAPTGVAANAATATPTLLAVTNLADAAQPSYRFGVPLAGRWVERIATGSRHYGGPDDDWPNGAVSTEPVPWSGHPQSLVLKLPARATLLLEHRG